MLQFFNVNWDSFPAWIHDEQNDCENVTNDENTKKVGDSMLPTKFVILCPTTKQQVITKAKLIKNYVCFHAAYSLIPLNAIPPTQMNIITPVIWWKGKINWRTERPGKKKVTNPTKNWIQKQITNVNPIQLWSEYTFGIGSKFPLGSLW